MHNMIRECIKQNYNISNTLGNYLKGTKIKAITTIIMIPTQSEIIR
jgi:hypothetical protein